METACEFPVRDRSFVPVNFDVIQFRASQADRKTETHADWSLSYDPEPIHEDAIVVIGALHVGGPGGWADISVGSFFLPSGAEGEADLPSSIATSEAAETLYDFARSHLKSFLGLIGADIVIPRKAPEPEVENMADEQLVEVPESSPNGGAITE